MKFLLCLGLASISAGFSGVAFGAGLPELAGRYEVTRADVPVSYELELAASGALTVTEKSPFGEATCKGQAVLREEVLSSSLLCPHGRTYEQRIYLAGVDAREPRFNAFVYTSVDGKTWLMSFRRL